MSKIIITGANRGLGFEFVKQLANLSRTTSICALCRNPSNAKALQDLAEQHKNVTIIKADVTEFPKYEELVDRVDNSFNGEGVNLLINNAGFLSRDDLFATTVENMNRSFEVNATAPLMLTKAFLPLLSKAEDGNSFIKTGKALVINLTTQLGSIKENTSSGYVPYRISKAALNMVTRTLATDLKPHNIFVVGLHPGWVRTEMGGPKAPLSAEDSVTAMLKVAFDVTEQHRGCMLGQNGREIPW